ncbi:hypothetical protein V1512DRAFT_257825 [Lipomyces arxii]|uniref:uncharacterized protein n=1 Tax=Lipomyces arxii TaxID=56418 RepID=UPI0034CE4E9B
MPSHHSSNVSQHMGRLYPRSTLRKIVKKHASGCKISKSADILIYLDYLLFLEELLKEANIEVRQNGEKVLRQRHIESVTDKVLQRFKG